MNFSSFVFPLSVTLTNFRMSESWDSVYTTVANNSASWEESAVIAPLQSASASWNSVYTTTQDNSAEWDSTYTTVFHNSASWEESADILPTVNNYLSTNNVLVSSINVSLLHRLATPQVVAGTGVRFFTSRIGDSYLVDTRTNVVSTVLPPNPTVGQAITYQDPYNTWDIRNFILGCSDQPIESSLESLSADVPGYVFTAIFVGSTFGWRIR